MVAQVRVHNYNEVASGVVHPVNVGCRESVIIAHLLRWLLCTPFCRPAKVGGCGELSF